MYQVKYLLHDPKVKNSLETHYTIESVIAGVEEITAAFKLIIVCEDDERRLAWPIWLDSSFVNKGTEKVLENLIKTMVRCEKGLLLK